MPHSCPHMPGHCDVITPPIEYQKKSQECAHTPWIIRLKLSSSLDHPDRGIGPQTSDDSVILILSFGTTYCKSLLSPPVT